MTERILVIEDDEPLRRRLVDTISQLRREPEPIVITAHPNQEIDPMHPMRPSRNMMAITLGMAMGMAAPGMGSPIDPFADPFNNDRVQPTSRRRYVFATKKKPNPAKTKAKRKAAKASRAKNRKR